jgi:hypothetical protein
VGNWPSPFRTIAIWRIGLKRSSTLVPTLSHSPNIATLVLFQNNQAPFPFCLADEEARVADPVAVAEYDDDRMDVSNITNKYWAWDAGRSNDLTNYDVAIRFRSSWVTGETLSFKTAGGKASGSDALPLCVGAFDRMFADPVVLRNAPVGRRTAESYETIGGGGSASAKGASTPASLRMETKNLAVLSR